MINEELDLNNILDDPDCDIESPESKYMIAQCYKFGKGIQADNELYAKYLKESAVAGFQLAKDEWMEYSKEIIEEDSESEESDLGLKKHENNLEYSRMGIAELLSLEQKRDPYACVELYKEYKNNGDDLKANEYSDKALRIAVEEVIDVEIFLKLGSYAENCGDIELAIDSYNYALEKNSKEALRKLIEINTARGNDEIVNEYSMKYAQIGDIKDAFYIAQKYEQSNIMNAKIIYERIKEEIDDNADEYDLQIKYYAMLWLYESNMDRYSLSDAEVVLLREYIIQLLQSESLSCFENLIASTIKKLENLNANELIRDILFDEKLLEELIKYYETRNEELFVILIYTIYNKDFIVFKKIVSNSIKSNNPQKVFFDLLETAIQNNRLIEEGYIYELIDYYDRQDLREMFQVVRIIYIWNYNFFKQLIFKRIREEKNIDVFLDVLGMDKNENVMVDEELLTELEKYYENKSKEYCSKILEIAYKVNFDFFMQLVLKNISENKMPEIIAELLHPHIIRQEYLSWNGDICYGLALYFEESYPLLYCQFLGLAAKQNHVVAQELYWRYRNQKRTQMK